MHAVLQESISGVYADLVTRPTGRVVRERIERAIAGRGGDTGEITIARMDFTGVGCIDYSCADEIVAKLLRDRPAVLVLSGITDGHREAIEPVLSGHGLAVLIERADGTLESLGAAAAVAALLDELVARRLAARRPGGTYALTPAGSAAPGSPPARSTASPRPAPTGPRWGRPCTSAARSPTRSAP